jgi:hypothetical protein
VGTALRQSFDHLTLWQRVGSVWGAEDVMAEKEVCMALEKWGRVVVS